MFWKRREEAKPALRPKAAVCYVDPGETRRVADWLVQLRVCEPAAILSDDPKDALWACLQEKPDILLLEAMPDAMEKLDDPNRDITGRCELSACIKEQLPACRVYLICGAQFRDLEPTLKKAVETGLIDGYRIGRLSKLNVDAWLAPGETGDDPGGEAICGQGLQEKEIR